MYFLLHIYMCFSFCFVLFVFVCLFGWLAGCFVLFLLRFVFLVVFCFLFFVLLCQHLKSLLWAQWSMNSCTAYLCVISVRSGAKLIRDERGGGGGGGGGWLWDCGR